MRLRTRLRMSTEGSVVISPATTTSPVVISVSQATRPSGSSPRTASSTESEIWSAILSGWPSVTDSEVKEKERVVMAGRLANAPSLLGWFTAHQACGEVGDALAREDRADAFGDRELHVETVREVAQNGGRRQTLDRLADLGDRPFRRQALGDELAGMAVAAVAGPARGDQGAEPREAGEVLRPRSRRFPEPCHLREATRDERGLRVVAEPEPVDAAGRERDHVLRRRAQLDTYQVGIHVGPEEARVQRVLELACEEPVLARAPRGRRRPLGDPPRHVRARGDGDRPAADPRGEALAGLGVEPLREAEHGRVARQRLNDLGEGLTRHRGDDDVDVTGSVGERDRLGFAEVDTLQVVGIPAGRRNRLRLLARAARQDDLVPTLEEDARERRPPGSRADHEKPHVPGRLPLPPGGAGLRERLTTLAARSCARAARSYFMYCPTRARAWLVCQRRPRNVRKRTSGSFHEVDRDRHAVQVESLTQLVLDPVAVVARDEAGVVDEDADARRAHADLRAVEEVEPPPPARPARGLSRLAQPREGTVQLGRREPRDMPVEELRDPVEEPLEAAAGVRRDGDERRPLAQAAAQLATDVLDADRGRVPLREDDERRAGGVPGNVGDGDVLLDDPLGGVDQDEGDVGTLRRLEGAQLGVELDPLPVPPLASQAGRVDEDEGALAALQHGVHGVAGGARDLAHDQPLAAEERVDEARLADVRPAEDRNADRV